MLGAGLDVGGPLALTLADVGACQQFAERQNAVERGADVVRESRERNVPVDCRRPPLAPAARRPRGIPLFRLFGPRPRHGAPRLVSSRLSRTMARLRVKQKQKGISVPAPPCA